ncbi:hypothetical protein [uncultured Anaerococcus sp.]|uniref:hypothetical protein n=1 Tax=uncultured Anaerococcus sp. TaxID=293428 RepID=UPI00288BA8D0|nr:hypothetical protein [uncultured Anaerococcus sp.]
MKIEEQQRYFDEIQTMSLEALIFMERKLEQSRNEKDREDKLNLIRIAIRGKRNLKRHLDEEKRC